MALTRIYGNLISSATFTGNIFQAQTITGASIAANTIASSNLTTTGVTAGRYGGTGNTVNITVDAQGRVTSAANVASGGAGDVAGPASSTDNAIARFDSTTGKLLQNSTGILTDAGAISGLTEITASGLVRSSGNGFQSGNATDSYAKFGYSTASAVLTITNEYNSGGAGSTYGEIVFKNYNANQGTLTERVRITGGGDFLAQKCMSVGGATPSSDGAGITFPAGQSPSSNANTLDDYEEGTWEPVYNFSTSGAANTVSNGRYIKIGSSVWVQGFLYINSGTACTGDATITGLPFASLNTNQIYYGFSIGVARRFNADMPNLRIALLYGETTLRLWKNATNASTETTLTNSDFNVQAEFNILYFQGTYRV